MIRKESVNPKGNQSWIFTGGTDAETETPTLWPPDAKNWHWERPWCWVRLKAGGGDNRGWDGWMAPWTWWTWVWASSRRWSRTGRPGVLQSMESQRVRHDWATELYWASEPSASPQKSTQALNQWTPRDTTTLTSNIRPWHWAGCWKTVMNNTDVVPVYMELVANLERQLNKGSNIVAVNSGCALDQGLFMRWDEISWWQSWGIKYSPSFLTPRVTLIAFPAFHPLLRGLLWNFNYTDNLLPPTPCLYDWGLNGYVVLWWWP